MFYKVMYARKNKSTRLVLLAYRWILFALLQDFHMWISEKRGWLWDIGDVSSFTLFTIVVILEREAKRRENGGNVGDEKEEGELENEDSHPNSDTEIVGE